ncbi:conserved hypothetical protein [Vibrio owensii]|uniref:Uncharacterized protein n=1 Tax=Vibrio owensii TaxID=696485 RepID=A0AAU9Q2P0_9VIBR|nr:conserved hypothetical protein [Vibrio owensii]
MESEVVSESDNNGQHSSEAVSDPKCKSAEDTNTIKCQQKANEQRSIRSDNGEPVGGAVPKTQE